LGLTAISIKKKGSKQGKYLNTTLFTTK